MSKCKVIEGASEGFVIKDSCGITLVDCDIYKNKGNGIIVRDTGAIKYVKRR